MIGADDDPTHAMDLPANSCS